LGNSATGKMTQCKFSSPQIGLAAPNSVFIETVNIQTVELTNKTTFTTYFQTLMIFLNPSTGIIKSNGDKQFPHLKPFLTRKHVRQTFAYMHSAIGFIQTYFY